MLIDEKIQSMYHTFYLIAQLKVLKLFAMVLQNARMKISLFKYSCLAFSLFVDLFHGERKLLKFNERKPKQLTLRAISKFHRVITIIHPYLCLINPNHFNCTRG